MGAPYRLGIDIGTNSLGWCVLELNRESRPCGLRRLGVRIYADGRDPQKGTSLAVDRRVARQARRRRDRLIDRRADLMRALIRHGLMPADAADRKRLEDCDPYALRAEGLDRLLTLHELGRAIFHLNQRRGFKSNRKTEKRADEKETAGMKGAIRETEARLQASGARTLGEYLHKEFRAGLKVRAQKPVRARRRGIGAKATYDLYPSRAMYEQEFDALWEKQAQLNPALTEAARAEIRDIVFFQRPLKPVDPGRCTLEPDQERAPIALPLAQQFRMLQELANLRIVGRDQRARPLDRNQRNRVLEKLAKRSKMSFDQIRKALKLAPDETLNLQSESRTDVKGDLTGAILAHKDRFGARWWTLGSDRQHEIVDTLLRSEDDAAIVSIATADWGLSEAAAQKVADTALPDGYARLGLNAMGKIVALLRDKGFGEYGYAEAAKEAGYHHSDFRTGEVFDALPYYGEALERRVAFGSGKPDDPPERRFGRIPNPTVHIGLNQLRKTVNAIIAQYGPPAEIVVELARELKLSARQKEDIEREQKANKSRNDDRRKKLAELGLADTGENMMRLRLWEELGPPEDRRCPYTGEPISITRLFSDEVEIEHILPFSRTLDDSAANRTVALRAVNREKRQYTPHEAFSTSPGRYVWDDILLRAGALPRNKRWRFAEDAMAQFEAKNDFLARQLTDTAYLARLTREYLSYVCHPDRVWVIPGRLTALLRGRWGLNKLLSDHNRKERTDHRHHAIDAFVTALTDRAMLKRVSDAAGAARERLIDAMPEPWEGFREDLHRHLDSLVVAHKPDHRKSRNRNETGRNSTTGRLHNDTAFGLANDFSAGSRITVVTRKSVAALTESDIPMVVDPSLRACLRWHFSESLTRGKNEKEAFEEFSTMTGIRRLRLSDQMAAGALIPIRDVNGRIYKVYKGDSNHCMEVWRLPDGEWTGQIVSTFEANQKGQRRRPHPAAGLVCRLFINDLVALRDQDGLEKVMRVVKASGQRVWFADHKEAGALKKRDADKDDPFKYFNKAVSQLRYHGLRKIGVDVLGNKLDPGPPT